MTLTELRKRLSDDTIDAQAIARADESHINSALACRVASISSHADSRSDRLQLPSDLVPLLP
ncbi:hypothetical protein [Burkholderia cepacia]|uniref:hypothetical protein n=1 Tax=Burkholderia cepacia TaxID=292 RepID=UPI000ABAE40E|nr:hypothetical protein [Burkholderia cepacia]